jgi:hypothetical protein
MATHVQQRPDLPVITAHHEDALADNVAAKVVAGFRYLRGVRDVEPLAVKNQLYLPFEDLL